MAAQGREQGVAARQQSHGTNCWQRKNQKKRETKKQRLTK
jgi:hypothetical protein